MTNQHRRVTPTEPPSMAVLLDGDPFALKDADHFQNRTDVVYRRLFYLEEPAIEDGFPQFRKGLRAVSYPDPRGSIEQEGWEVIATVRVMAGQAVVVHGCITQLAADPQRLPSGAVANARVEYLRARYDEEPPTSIIAMQRRMLDELHPAIEAADSLIAGEWGSSDLAETLLDLLMLPYYHREDCRYDWVAPVDRLAEKCAHEDAYGVAAADENEVRQHCPDCSATWPNPHACASCERCTWNPGPDCGKPEHPHCPTCGHCEGRHVREAKTHA